MSRTIRIAQLTVSVAARLVLAAALAALLVVGSTVVRVWQVARQDHRPSSDAIIVLGSAQYDGRPSAVLTARLQHALALYEQHVAPQVVTVGGRRPGDRFTEAGTGRTWLIRNGVPANRVVAVERGNDTLASMLAVGSVFTQRGWHTAVLVTDPWHALRSETMARAAGMTAVTSPTRRGPAVRTRHTEIWYIARETGAYLYYRVLARSPDDGPAAV